MPTHGTSRNGPRPRWPIRDFGWWWIATSRPLPGQKKSAICVWSHGICQARDQTHLWRLSTFPWGSNTHQTHSSKKVISLAMTKLWLHVFSAMPGTRCHPAGEAAYQAYSSQRYSSDWGLTQIFNGWIRVMCTQSCVIKTLVKDKNLYDAHIRLINPGWLADWSLGQSPIWPDCQSLPNYHTPENDAGKCVSRMAVRWCFSFIFAGVQPSLTLFGGC